MNLAERSDDPAPASSAVDVPLVLDVDGTLLLGDLTLEHTIACAAAGPASAIEGMRRLARGGRPALKRWLVETVPMAAAELPPNPQVLALIEEARAEGRPIVLASASDQHLVDALAERYGPFDAVLGSDGTTNLSGARKAAALNARYGQGGWDYAGDASVDLAVWADARRAILVSGFGPAKAGLKRRVEATGKLERVLARPIDRTGYLRALRPHQWLKNLLVFVPVLAGHQLGAGTLLAALMAWAAFSMAASSAYLINDVVDLPNDRRHPTKSRRPIAAGRVPVLHAVVGAAGLLALAAGLAALLPPAFALVLLGYVNLTLGYSFVLKRILMVDVVTLGGLYTSRILAGGTATGIVISEWLFAFALLLFMALAIVKRLVELIDVRARGGTGAAGRGYTVGDVEPLGQLAAACGIGAAIVLALYINSEAVQQVYRTPELLWVLWLMLIYWLGRLLTLTHRGTVDDDPILFAATDRTTLGLGVAGVAAVLLAAV
ncbi:MAG: UbiA family prenyltransferase [Pseudomonadota bacterium]